MISVGINLVLLLAKVLCDRGLMYMSISILIYTYRYAIENLFLL